MCLAIPGKIISIDDTQESPRMAKVNFGGVIKSVCIDWLPDAKLGEYVMVHVGFAISKVDEKEAEENLNLIVEMEEELKKRIEK
ncbi:MAG: HypC/HybG/HupF family hydrogenase formation chaperone [Ignavibacteriales bacterium]|nr:HypC/HybG/HupF family hydrogenase formation chaperone [Ignavibacteriales bacterium]